MVREIGRIEVDEKKCVLCLTCLRTLGAEIEEQKRKQDVGTLPPLWTLYLFCPAMPSKQRVYLLRTDIL